ncbi:acetyl-CoA carboxylase carboxyltransferase subunit alpha [Romboutsia sp.]|uniref:acetyl-CoA carboxylase carboxyltransferase subunit alpha n=1 Tax=Romboutsia sp. TaxID=1965302 RepID=UPI002D1909D5|nr:acetyl-CoA carboxylase carboxyltransferase subunit alpha [Romboutsia sp.]HSQ87502.1 acetyl-CoA carboxylase carboxyltransferase subunit alpha [Romboutsia sp.]
MHTIDTDIQEKIEKLEEDINKLKLISSSNEIDLSDKIIDLEKKLDTLKSEACIKLSPYEKVCLSRDIKRPTTKDYIDKICSNFIELHGDRLYKDDPSIIGGIGKIDKFSVTIIGHQKGNDVHENIKRNFGMPHPEGYRKALRLMKQAEKFKRPIITFIDTPGAFCGLEAEERGQGEAIARNLLEMSKLSVPIICFVIGEGGSGGALGIGVGNEICMLEHSVYSVISPEGLSSILFKDASKSKEASEVMKLTSQDLYELKIVDKIIEEPFKGVQQNIEPVSRDIKSFIIDRLNHYENLSEAEIISHRYNKFREIGRCL